MIVVGNISVGGTGKTPLTVWLVEELKARGWQPGIVSRGYGGDSEVYPMLVTADSSPSQVGDEPVLLARRTGCPLVVDPQRVCAAQTLIEDHKVDIIVSDDGLQHYALARDVEIVVIDAQRRCGNGMLLPAGPLREGRSRLQQVDAVLINGADDAETGFTLSYDEISNLRTGEKRSLRDLQGTVLHAVAGIGNPERFFSNLEDAGLSIERHAFPDHHSYFVDDISYADGQPVLMTEKDAVKCRSFADDSHWYLPVTAIPNAAGKKLIHRILSRLPIRSAAGKQKSA